MLREWQMTRTWIHRRIGRSLLYGVLAAVLAVMSGCCMNKSPYFAEPKCPVVKDLNCPICPKQQPCSFCRTRALICYLHMHGVQVIRVGEDMRVIIPSDLLFKPYSANFKCDYLPVLDGLAQFMWCFDKIDGMVAGFTDCCGESQRNLMLSRLQAQKIGLYLWRKGIDTRLLHTKGFGMKYPIAKQSLKNFHGRARNRRIEITFRHLPARRHVDV